MRLSLFTLGIIFAVTVIGCHRGASDRTNKSSPAASKSEDEIKQSFTDLQAAIKAKDADKIWNLLDKERQADAEREAKAVKDSYVKVADKGKAELEKKLDLSAKDITDMTGKLYVKSQIFYAKHHEIPGSTVETITVNGDSAKLIYKEVDGDTPTTNLARENGRWKFRLAIPRFQE